MKRDIRFNATYPHPIDLVWSVLTDPASMGEWLMPNDFRPQIGHRFTFRTDPAPGFDGIVHCEVLELDAPRALALAWRAGSLDTVLRIELEPVRERATRLRLAHTGFEGLRNVLVAQILGRGTTRIYGRLLPAYLDRVRPDGSLTPAPRPEHMRDPISQLIARIAARLK
jgi:uncharacterized protein YndB with AHSA1/START domain